MAILDLFNLPMELSVIIEYQILEYIVKSMFLLLMIKTTIEAIFDLAKHFSRIR